MALHPTDEYIQLLGMATTIRNMSSMALNTEWTDEQLSILCGLAQNFTDVVKDLACGMPEQATQADAELERILLQTCN